ncbi:hypothetical protein HK103_004665 [Boothiomyces macroporosus]|uniref:Major facilitator superfamily (MFS) profile domain-containing protein n=1 Tax=Boothiomyces macroporosus TaxID=261099 RepID=A0AAD5ULU2_9FUNG|nr:hypothetical protein HK103_004665 [Boothiomyces macroporosus]
MNSNTNNSIDRVLSTSAQPVPTCPKVNGVLVQYKEQLSTSESTLGNSVFPEVIVQLFKPKSAVSLPVDTGYAWIVVLSSFIVQFFTLGLAYISGIYIADYIKDPMFTGYSTSEISLIGSFTTAGMPFFAIPAGNLVDRFGHRTVGIVGGVLYMLSLVLASLSCNYWQLLLTQGVMLGLTISIAYFPALTIVSQWFDKKKGLATGIAVGGSGIGGLVLSPITSWMISSFGRERALLVTGIVGGSAIILSSMAYQARLPLTKKSSDYVSLLKNSRFQLLYTLLVIATFGYLAPFFYLPSYAADYKISSTDGALLVGILNGASGIGRVILGYGADSFGHINSFTVCLLLASLSVLLIWPFAQTFPSLAVFASVYGLFVGGYVSILPNVVIKMFGLENIGSKIGLIYSTFFFGSVFGPYIIGYLIDSSTTGNQVNYFPVILFSGISMFIATVMLAITKYLVGNYNWLTKV